MNSDSSIVEASDMMMAQYQQEIEALYHEKMVITNRLKQMRTQIESLESQHQQLLQDEIAISAECGQYEAQQTEILQRVRRSMFLLHLFGV